MYKSNIITQKCMYFMITLVKQRAFVGKNEMIYESPSERVPEHFLAHTFFLLFTITRQLGIFWNQYTKRYLLNTNIYPFAHFLLNLGRQTYCLCTQWWDIDINRKGKKTKCFQRN